MFVVNTHITIGNLFFDFIMDGEIDTSWKNLTDRAELKLPRNISIFSKPELLIQEIIKKGDKVKIELGYDGNLQTEFIGYVSEVQIGIPIVLQCEDSTYLLKQHKVSNSWRNATLEDIIKDIVPAGMQYKVADFKIGAYYAKNATAAIVLKDLQTRYAMKPFFRDEVLYVGFAYPTDKWKAVKYDFSINAKAKNKKLKYTAAGDEKFHVKGISINSKGEKTIVEVGDPSGAERTLHYYNVDEATLRTNTENDYKKLQYEGFRGSFHAFAIPFAQHGDIAFLKDEFYPENKGAYFVDRVKTTFGFKVGIDREVFLGPRASNTELNDITNG